MKSQSWLPLVTIVPLVMACGESNQHKKVEANKTQVQVKDVDNTAKNVRDRDFNTITPGDQSEADSDLKITQAIRKRVMADDTISMDGKNVKIMTIEGVVTLRGVANTENEKGTIEKKLDGIAGVNKVVNQIEVKKQ